MIPNEKYKTLFKPLHKIQAPVPTPTQHRVTIPLKTNDSLGKTDLLEEFAKVGSAAQVLFLELKLNYSKELGIVSYPDREGLTNSKATAYKLFSRKITELKKAKLIGSLPKKLQRELGLEEGARYYLLNPTLVNCFNYTAAKQIWEQIQK